MPSVQDALNIFKKFKFFFDIRGVETVELDNSPDGWRNTIIEYDRSKVYNGVLRNLTLPYKFVNRAAYICRREYAKYSLLARVNQQILIGDGRNNYTQIYQGKLDFATKQDTETGFTISSKTADFSTNIDAYADQKYSISLEDGVMVELTPIILNETASLLISRPPDGNIHSDYFPPIQVVNNQQNSIDASVFSVTYQQFRDPNFAASGTQFFKSRIDQNLYIKGSLKLQVSAFGSGHHLALYICNAAGAIVYTIYDVTPPNGSSEITIDINTSFHVTHGDQLYLYMRQYDAETINTGITILSGQLDLSYQTITPATMCNGITLDTLFGKLLQNMNVNDNSEANLPIAYQSFLLKTTLKDIVVTSSDSIRASQGSIYHAGDTLFQGIYEVLSGTAIYGGTSYTTGQKFTYTPAEATFTGSGVVRKITAIYAGVTYQVGDTLQAGGTYLVQGGAIVYNSVSYAIGTTFKYVLGHDTFTGGTSAFVTQIAAEPQLITSFSDFYQTVKSLMGGNCAFGVDRDGTLQGKPFIETMAYVFRSSVGTVKLGNVDKAWKSTSAIDLLYNKIKVGYEDQQYDAINGEQEVNSTQYYGTDLMSPVSELNLISAYRADPIGIETVRVTQQDTAASRSDNDAFMVWINPDPVTPAPFVYYHPLLSEGAISMTGVSPSYYNYYLSPKHNLLRGDSYLASIFYNMAGYQIKLTSALKNSALIVTDLDGKKVVESAPINISDLPAPYFIPEYFDINVGSTVEIMNMLDANPYNYLTFVVNGKTAKAFIVNVKVDIGKESVQELKLLLTANNNLSDFVR